MISIAILLLFTIAFPLAGPPSDTCASPQKGVSVKEVKTTIPTVGANF
jgi:hypothetical protein